MKSLKPIFKIISFTKHFWKWYAFMGVFVLGTSILSLIIPLVSKKIVDIIVADFSGKEVELSLFVFFLGAILTTDIFISLFTAFSQWIGDILTVKLHTYLSIRFYKHVLNLDISYFDNEIAGTIVNKMYRGITSITEFIKAMLTSFLPFFFTAFVTILLLAYYSPFISVLLIVLFPSYVFISHKSTEAWEKYERQKNTLIDTSQGRVSERLSGIRVVKAFVLELFELKTFSGVRETIEKLTITQTKDWHIYDFIRRFVLNIILFCIYAYIVYWTLYDLYTIGEMTLLVQLVNQARFPLFAMSYILGQIQQASTGSQAFFDMLEVKQTVVDKKHAQPLVIFDRKIQNPFISFQNISFRYNKGNTVLSKISFDIKNHEKIALVGESGQGKSTLVNLLLRYYEPQKGKILLNGQDIAHITQKSLHENIAVVFQESLLFSGTIMENILYGKPDAAKKDVTQAAKAANAHSFIIKLPHGYNSTIGERGLKLSGGQKQRIAVARAILKNAPIIILDEATSSLDSKAELAVQKGLDQLLHKRTAIIIAHRLSTISNADRIVVIKQGGISQIGTSKQLLKDKNGLYAQLVALQQHVTKLPSKEKQMKLEKYDIVG